MPKKILIIDDDEDVRKLHCLRLSDTYETVATGDPEEALALALEHKPAAILLDLMMPQLSGFELCQTLGSLSYTSLIPLFVVSGQTSDTYKQHCQTLGARGFFAKPVNYTKLKATLHAELESRPPERRTHVRLNIRVVLKLRGRDAAGSPFELSTVTENASPAGFLANCALSLRPGDPLEVFVVGAGEQFAGRARAVRVESEGTPWQRYGFHFVEVTGDWILRDT